MTTLPTLCTSLEPAKRLAELKVPQESVFYYTRPHGVKAEWKLEYLGDEEKKNHRIHGYFDLIAAPTSGELLEWLPYGYLLAKAGTWNTGKLADFNTIEGWGGENLQDQKTVDALAKAIIHLIEQGLIQASELK